MALANASGMKTNAMKLGIVTVAVVLLGLFAAACGDSVSDGIDADHPGAGQAAGGNEGNGTSSAESGSGGGAKVPTTTGLPCDVDAILKTRCQTCHAATPAFGASAPLVTWSDLQKPAPHDPSKKVYELALARVHSDAAPMPPSPQTRLTDQESKVLEAWITGGAAQSNATCTNEAPKDGVKPLSCTPDTILKPKSPFTMQAGAKLDQYMCFGVDVKVDKKRHVTALAPQVDNKAIVHHILLFQTTSAESSDPFPCEAFGSAAWKLVAGWAPGGENLELPPEAGFPEEAGTTHWVLQVHYNNAKNATGQMDSSGYQLCTTDQLRANDAGVLAFGSTSFSIPPRSTTTVKCDYRLGLGFNNKKFFNASPHMHTRGVAMSTERLVGGSASNTQPMFEQKNFSFEAQSNYPIAKEATTGDVMRTRCTWKNPTDGTIGFGEGTADEMCFNFFGYYPAIPDLGGLFTWVTPSALALCSTDSQ